MTRGGRIDMRPDASLPEFLVARARAASDGRLVVDVVAGLAAAIAIGARRPVAWPSLLGASLSLAAFGAWGIADRELRERAQAPHARATRWLGVVRVVAVVVGALAAVTAVFGALGVVLGTWIS